MMKQMLFNTLSLIGVAMQSFFTAIKERFANKMGLSVHKMVFGISVLALVFFTAHSGFAQCAAAGSVTTTITTTPNTCAGNGTIKATFSSATNITIQLIKGGSELQAVNNPVSPYTFTNLQPGTDYEIKTICSTNNSIVYSDNPNITVSENYVAISDADITVSNLCANFTQGGTITVNGVTGGTAPYQYSIILNNSAGYDDILSSYSTPASSPPYTKNVTAFGTYQIRIKDACGNYKTFTKTLTPTLEAIKFFWRSRKICAPNSPKKAEMFAWYAVGATTGANVSVADYTNPGIKMEIRDVNASGAILFSGIYTADGITYTESPTHQYYITTTNGCGLTTSYTHDLSQPNLDPEFNDFLATSGNAGCGAEETMSISASFVEQFYWKFPVTVIIKNAANVQVGAPVTGVDFNGIANFTNLPLGTYTVIATDQCGESFEKTVNSPTGSGTPALSIYQTTNWRCDPLQPLITTGTVQVVVQFSGYIPDRANAIVKIVSGPSNVGVIATLIDGQYYGWTNMAPGTYSVSVKSCGVEKFYPLTISASDPGLLKQSLSSTAESFCSGGGNINSTKVFNGAYVNTVELLNLTGTVVASHVLGNFTNIPAGTYTTRIKVVACNSTYYILGSTVTLTNSTTGPKITSSTGVICESGTGTPLTTGSAYLNLAGVAPFTVQYRVQGSTGAFTTLTTSNASLQIDNLIANTTYEVNLKDACGGNFPTTVQVKTVGVLTTNNSAQPCIGSPYTLSMPEYAGATYQWINATGTVLSNTRFYEFASYLAANDGVYTCKITWSNCVTRQATVTLNSALCGQTIGNCGLIDSDGDGVFDFCDLDDDNDGILDVNECNSVEKVLNGFNVAPTTLTSWTATPASNGWIPSSGIAIETSNDAPGIYKIEQTVNGLIPGKAYVLTFEAFALGSGNPNPNTLSVNINGSVYYSKGAVTAIGSTPQSESINFSTNSTSATIEFISTVTGTLGNTGKDVFVKKVSILACELDTDGDGIPDYLDLDSDNDGCVDALEGDENVTSAQLVTASGTVAVGFGSSASKQNLGNTVDTNGIPTIVNAGGAADIGGDVGQGVGISINNLINACCTNPPATGTPDGYTKTGISNLVGFTGGATGWPGNVPNGFVAIESKNKGFVITRVASSSSILAPVEGMLIYDIAAACIKLYNGTAWNCLAKACN